MNILEFVNDSGNGFDCKTKFLNSLSLRQIDER